MGKIRTENKADLLQITEIHNQAFGDTEESQIVTDLRKNDNSDETQTCHLLRDRTACFQKTLILCNIEL